MSDRNSFAVNRFSWCHHDTPLCLRSESKVVNLRRRPPAQRSRVVGNSRSQGDRRSQRNRHDDLTIPTIAGLINLKRPILRNTTERFASELLGKGVVRSAPLEALVISAWVRGLSDRDIEALLAEALGSEAALSKSTASRICSQLTDRLDAFRNPDLAGIDLDDLLLDGSHLQDA
jgi:transposase-like protein